MSADVAVCMIVRDALDAFGDTDCLLADLLASRVPLSEIVVVDTGSQDGTFERLCGLIGANPEAARDRTHWRAAGVVRDVNLTVVKCPWVDDFAFARNIAFGHARARWRGYLDADDRINAESLARLLEHIGHAESLDVEALVMRYDYADDVQEWPIRFVDSTKGWRWERRVHETLHPTSETRDVRAAAVGDVVVIHARRPATAEAARVERNTRLAQLGYDEAKAGLDAKSAAIYAFYLGHAAYTAGHHDEAAKLYEEAATAMAHSPIAVPAGVQRGWIALERKDYADAEKWAGHAIAIDETLADAWFVLGIALHRQRRYDAAAVAFDGGRAAPAYRLRPLVFGVGRIVAALAYVGAGRVDDAEKALRETGDIPEGLLPMMHTAEAAILARRALL